LLTAEIAENAERSRIWICRFKPRPASRVLCALRVLCGEICPQFVFTAEIAEKGRVGNCGLKPRSASPALLCVLGALGGESPLSRVGPIFSAWPQAPRAIRTQAARPW
jgi:hypothetical protein